MAGILDNFGQILYEEVIGKKDVYIQEASLLDMWRFFIECAIKNSRIKKCAIGVERKGDHYNIAQVMLNRKNEAIMIDGEFCTGRRLVAYSIDEDIENILESNNIFILDLDVLKK